MNTIELPTVAPPLLADKHEVYTADTVLDPFGLVATLPATVLSYIDPSGTDATVYRVKTYDAAGNLLADTGAFQPAAVVKTNLSMGKVLVDHDYGSSDNLRVVGPNGAPIGDAKVFAFKQADWLAYNRRVPEQATTTLADGRWGTPMRLEPGFTYVLVVERRGFVPTTKEILV